MNSITVASAVGLNLSNQSQPLLVADNLTCIREDRLLFEDLSFALTPGTIVQVEGPNGTGKTSLLRILAGLSQPYSGEIRYQDTHINDCREEYCQDLLFLGHLAGVKNEMTAQENLEFNLNIHCQPSDHAELILQKVNLLGFEDAPASNLSAGQHRRISLARLWQSDAKIWILDEPFTAIDKAGVKKLEALFLKHAQNGGVVVLTTHQDLSYSPDQYQKITLEYRFY